MFIDMIMEKYDLFYFETLYYIHIGSNHVDVSAVSKLE
jgi:hypothetical protein